MYKVIIVDDEQNIRDRLIRFLPWADVGFEVIGSAENGREALRLIKQEQPQVVLTDVLMSEMTGLELAKEIISISHDIKVIILSAYDDFKYAQEAIQYGVKGYLLKPLMKKDFYDVFTKLAEELNEDASLKKVSIADKKWSTEELMLLDLIKGVNLPKYTDKWEYQNQYSRVAIFSFEKMFKETSTFSIRQRITELAAGFWKRYNFPILFYGNSLILLIIERKPVSKKDLKPKILLFIDNLQHNLEGIFKDKDNFVVGVGNSVRSIQEVSRSYNEAVYASSYKYFSDKETIIFYEDLSKSDVPGKNVGTQTYILDHVNSIEGKLTESVLTGEVSEISDNIDCFFEALERFKGQQIPEIQSSCSEFVIMLIIRLKEKGLVLPSIDNQHVLSKIYEIDSLKELKRWLRQTLETISYDLTKKGEQNFNRYVLIAKEYVKSNYHEKITLEEISNILFLHQAYFSAIFKKETGQNFIDYVNKVRVEKAAQMLIESDHKIKMISDMVGFHSHSYFNKVFKNDTGVTPVVFRRQQKQ